jgi:hypothetical protein
MATYSSSMPGTAGRLISPVAIARRCSRRAIALPSGELSTEFFYLMRRQLSGLATRTFDD